jgi:DnaJ-class molecular chaperone
MVNPYEKPPGKPEGEAEMRPCPKCGGSGSHNGKPCDECKGRGKIPRPH